MSPFQINILLWYYARTEDYRNEAGASVLTQECIDDFVAKDLLKPAPVGCPYDAKYVATDRLLCYVRALMDVPLPTWTVVWPTPLDTKPLET